MSTSMLASVLRTNQRDRALVLVDGGEGAAAEVLGVGEEQRRVVAVDHQPRHGARPRVVVDVVHAGQARHEAQDRVVRPGDAGQHLGDGQARPRAGRRTGCRRRAHRRARRARAAVRCAGTRRAAGTRRRRSAGARRRRRCAPSAAVGKWARSGPSERAGPRRPPPGRPASTAGCGCRRRPSAVRLPLLLTGKPRQQARADVGRAEGEQLLVGVDPWPSRLRRRRGR